MCLGETSKVTIITNFYILLGDVLMELVVCFILSTSQVYKFWDFVIY
jgi:hypothetical protein